MKVHKTSLAAGLDQLPLPATEKWPTGVWDIEVMRHGTFAAEVFAPRGVDHQTPHAQDELYIVVTGTAALHAGDDLSLICAAGDLLFVPAGMPHHFENISEDFVTWVIFYGPEGGETSGQTPRSVAVPREIQP